MVRKILTALGVAILLLLTPISIQASSNDDQPYTVRPVIPSNQDGGVTSYISVSKNNGKLEQDMEFLVTNNTDEEMEILIKPINALTSPHGIIQYFPELERDNSMIIDKKYGFGDYADVQDKVILSGGESKVVTAKVNIGNVEGTVLGAVGFKLIEDTDIGKTEEAQFSIKNEIKNIVGVQVNFPTENKGLNLEFGDAYAVSMPAYYEVRMPVSHLNPTLVKDVDLEYKVKDTKGKELFKSKKGLYFDFAPKTKVDISLPWKYDKIEKNTTYILEGKFVKGDQEFPFVKEFQLKGDENGMGTGENRPPLLEDGFPWWLLLIALLALLIAYLIYRFRNVWVLLSESNQADERIEKENELYDQVVHVTKVNKEEKRKSQYMHVYKRRKDTDEGTEHDNEKEKVYYYEYHTTKRIKKK